MSRMKVCGWTKTGRDKDYATQDTPKEFIEADSYEDAIAQYQNLHRVDYAIATNKAGYQVWTREEGFRPAS